MMEGSEIKRYREKLKTLSLSHSVAALKTGTEIEDMDFEEIALLKEIAGDIPLIVKIGGPEARNDMRKCIALKVDTILAPMVETVYALTNFVSSAREIAAEMGHQPGLAINIESVTAAQNFDAMLESTSMGHVRQVTVGRSDLSRSLHLPIDDPEVISLAANVAKKTNNRGMVSSIGGGLSIKNIALLCEAIPAARFNSRHIVFANDSAFRKNPERSLLAGLGFEEIIYQFLAANFPAKGEFYKKRAQTLRRRMNGLKLVRKSN